MPSDITAKRTSAAFTFQFNQKEKGREENSFHNGKL
ncbi:hypothetical protein SLEP1_g44530 [Rubroshorea leprosula]|uniref:Uncharacterized protein n=1 Tax=Rubroshorea leprosula TaxID=152421 RepID=A0AAV5LH00_9ROSI|nr:hypothetical protein SLEP1_g44530 [Rubroshorea leprosula]